MRYLRRLASLVMAPSRGRCKRTNWFHDLLVLAAIPCIVVAVDAGATPMGIAMARVTQCGLGVYQSKVASW